MIPLPDLDRAFEHENNFYLSCEPIRIGKILAHYELYKLTQALPGAIVECGVFKGTSLLRFAAFRDLFGNSYSKKIIGFDTFGDFPETHFSQDQLPRSKFIEAAGKESISKDQLLGLLKQKGTKKNIDLIEGDIIKTVPDYVANNPALKISLLNLDTDIYEPAVVILRHLFPKIVKGGVLILDDYGVFPGETQAVDEFFADQDLELRKFPFSMTPCYVIKE